MKLNITKYQKRSQYLFLTSECLRYFNNIYKTQHIHIVHRFLGEINRLFSMLFQFQFIYFPANPKPFA